MLGQVVMGGTLVGFALLAVLVACSVGKDPTAGTRSGNDADDCAEVVASVKAEHEKKKEDVTQQWGEMNDFAGSGAAGEVELVQVENNVNGNEVITKVKKHTKDRILAKKAKMQWLLQESLTQQGRKERHKARKDKIAAKLAQQTKSEVEWLQKELDDSANDADGNAGYAKYIKEKQSVAEAAKDIAHKALKEFYQNWTQEDIKANEDLNTVKQKYSQYFADKSKLIDKVKEKQTKEVANKIKETSVAQVVKAITTKPKLTNAEAPEQKKRYFELKETMQRSGDKVDRIYEQIEVEVNSESDIDVKEALRRTKEHLGYLVKKLAMYREKGKVIANTKEALTSYKQKLKYDKERSSNDPSYDTLIDSAEKHIDKLTKQKEDVAKKEKAYEQDISTAITNTLDSILPSNSNKKEYYKNKFKEYTEEYSMLRESLHKMEEILDKFVAHYDDSDDANEENRKKLDDCNE